MNRTKITMPSLIMPRRRRCSIIVVMLLTVLLDVITSSVFTTAANTVTANGAFTRGNSNKKKKKKKECYEHDNCKSCLNSKDQSDCVWQVNQKRSGKKFGECMNKKECVPVPPAIDRSIITYCQEGTKRKKKLKTLKPSQWKKRNKKRCSKLKEKLKNVDESTFTGMKNDVNNDEKNDDNDEGATQPIVPTSSCSERSFSCSDCLHGNREEDGDEFCVYVPETNGCYDSCGSDEIPPMDSHHCFTGMVSKKEATDTCASIVQDQKNAELCQSKSQLNCEECTSTTFDVLKPDGTIKEGGTCQWFDFPNDEFTIGGSGGYCASECDFFNGCGATTCDEKQDITPIKPLPDEPLPDDWIPIDEEESDCNDRSSCFDCLHDKGGTDELSSSCSYIPEANGCYDSCGWMDVPMDVSCYGGSLTETDATNLCAAIVQDQENSELCGERSDSSCEECTSTKLNVLTKDGKLNVDAETCRWFASGYCGYQCNWWDGCGETTCENLPVLPPDKPPVIVVPIIHSECNYRSSCFDCLYDEGTDELSSSCSYVPSMNACYASCSTRDGAPTDVDCFGVDSLTETEAKKLCAASVQDQENSELCYERSDSCEECTSTKLNILTKDGELKVDAETCQWFSHDESTIFVDDVRRSGYCGYQCNWWDGCGETTCLDYNDNDLIRLPDTDLDEINRRLCSSKSHLNCLACTNTEIEIYDVATEIPTASTCRWFPAEEGVFTIGGSGGRCAPSDDCVDRDFYGNEYYYCGESTCDDDIFKPPPIGEVEDDDVYPNYDDEYDDSFGNEEEYLIEVNSDLCRTKDECSDCTDTIIKTIDAKTGKSVPSTCYWYRGKECILLDDDEKNNMDGTEGDLYCGASTCCRDNENDDPLSPYEDDDDEFEDDDDEEFLDEYNSDLCRSQTKCDDCVQTSLKLPTGVSTLVAPTCNWIPPSFEDFDDEEVEMEIETGRCVGNGYCSHRCEKGMYNYNCGVTGLGTDVCLLPKEGTEFLKYIGSEEYTGNEVKIMLLDSYPGLNIEIFEEGSTVTKDYRYNRVRVFVEASDDDDDDYDDTCNRKVVSAPKVG